MPIEIIVPRLGWSMEEGAFVAWLKKDGEMVRAGEALFSIEGDKAVQEIDAIDSGILRIAVNAPQPGQAIRVGDVLGHLLTEQEAAGQIPQAQAPSSGARAERPAAPVTPSPPKSFSAPPVAAVPARHPASDTTVSAWPAGTSAVPTISPRALRVAAEFGVDWTKVKGSGRTGRIREQDIRAAASRGSAGVQTTRDPNVAGGSTRLPNAGSGPGAGPGPDPAVLVTGGGGFIGTWVLRELMRLGIRAVVLDPGPRPARWQRVIGAAQENVTLIHGSLLDRDRLMQVFADHAITHVIHLAALLTPACQVDPWEGCQVNVMGTLAVLEQIRVAGDRIRGFSYASSVAVFGDEPDHGGATAGRGNLPVTFYGAFKKAVEMFAEQYWRHFRVASVGVRPQVAYGPERDSGLTAGPSLAARAAALQEPYCIRYTGRLGYDYVEDVARAFVRGALETPQGAHVVDLSGDTVDVREVVATLASIVPAAEKLLSVDGPPVPAHAPPNPQPITTLFPDWKTTSLEDGLRQTVEFYRRPESDIKAPGRAAKSPG